MDGGIEIRGNPRADAVTGQPLRHCFEGLTDCYDMDMEMQEAKVQFRGHFQDLTALLRRSDGLCQSDCCF
jgi:hypothetical protein